MKPQTQTNIDRLHMLNPAELVADEALVNSMLVSVDKHKRGFTMYMTNTKYNATTFTDTEATLAVDIACTVLINYFKKMTQVAQQTENLVCPSCNENTLSLEGNAWICENCGYKIKHYEGGNNDTK